VATPIGSKSAMLRVTIDKLKHPDFPDLGKPLWQPAYIKEKHATFGKQH